MSQTTKSFAVTGYIIDENRLQQMLITKCLINNDRLSWQLEAKDQGSRLAAAASIIAAGICYYCKESGVGSLDLQSVWTGSGKTNYCLTVPHGIKTESLAKLKTALEVDEEPQHWYSTDSPEPAHLQEFSSNDMLEKRLKIVIPDEELGMCSCANFCWTSIHQLSDIE